MLWDLRTDGGEQAGRRGGRSPTSFNLVVRTTEMARHLQWAVHSHPRSNQKIRLWTLFAPILRILLATIHATPGAPVARRVAARASPSPPWAPHQAHTLQNARTFWEAKKANEFIQVNIRLLSVMLTLSPARPHCSFLHL